MLKKFFRNHKLRLARTWKVRHQFSVGFFTVVFPFFFLVTFFIHFLARHGISLNHIMSPAAIMIIIGILCLILGYMASLFLMDIIFTPLEDLGKASREVAKGNYDVQIDYDGNVDEIESTIQNFNFMVRELNSVEIMRNDFIANVSHEFKTPLSSITGYVTLLQEPDLTEEERNEYIQMAFFNIEKLNDLTGNILQLSKLENQTSLTPPVTYRLDEQIREAIVLLEPKWSARDISFDLHLSEVRYTGQQALLLQVWTNLIGNAIKFSHPGGTISMVLKENQQDLEVIISDDGIGMSKETQAHIFEKFYQGDSSRRSQGNGLGLALCKKILDLCNGRIYVASELGKGSIFLIRLDKND